MSDTPTTPNSEAELKSLLSAIARGTAHAPSHRLFGRLAKSLAVRTPNTFSRELVELCERWTIAEELEIEALARDTYAVWTQAISGMRRPSEAIRSAFSPTRLAIREILAELDRLGSVLAGEYRNVSSREWLERSVRQIPPASAMVDGQIVDDFYILPEDDNIPYPVAHGKDPHEELVCLLRAYRFREAYNPSAHDISVGLHKFLNEPDRPRIDWLNERVDNWLKAGPGQADQTMQEIFDSWKQLFEAEGSGETGDRQFLSRALRLFRLQGGPLATQLLREQGIVRYKRQLESKTRTPSSC